jgi:hypothetical protein
MSRLTVRNDNDLDENDIMYTLQLLMMLKSRAHELMPRQVQPVKYNWFDDYYEFTAAKAVNIGIFDELSDRIKIRAGTALNIYG